ncbi:MAG: thymidylate synthase [Candidatus Poribacteria bacterium]|nr:thymidylate synthase [Candidatus Poribacteria bacterium]
MRQYLDALKNIMENGVDREGRNGPTRALFGMQMRYDMADGFPAVTTKKLFFDTMKAELLCFLSGSSDVKDFQRLGCHIWDANADADYWKPKARFDGDLGRIYGVQWRSWQTPGRETIDQLAEVIAGIQKNPYSRRLVVTAWNPGELDQMALEPCHIFFQFFVANGELSVQMYQRSCDMFLGVPFNIASYALLLRMIAQVTGLKPGEFIHTLGDAHIYHVHFDAVKKQLQREPLKLPSLSLNPDIKSIDDFKMSDIKLRNYKHHGVIKAPMVV